MNSEEHNETNENNEDQLQNIIGLGEFSVRKSYYPELQKKLQELSAEKDRAQKYLDIAEVLIVALNDKGDVTLINHKGSYILGYEQNQIIGKNWFETFIPEKSRDEVRRIFTDIMSGLIEQRRYNESLIISRKGEERIIAWNNTTITDNEGNCIGVLSSGMDITERKKAEEEKQRILKEKETLLFELYHRTRNNMQLIISLLALKAELSTNEEVKHIFKEMENKILSMALVHQKLYRSKDLSNINFSEYIRELVELLLRNNLYSKKITFDINTENLFVLFDIAIPCGLVLNELISNALKHAFTDKESGIITIKLRRINIHYLELSVSDNGKGLPQDFDIRSGETIGLTNVIMLVEKQLSGEINFVVENGLHCHIKIRDDIYSKRV